MAQAMAFLFEAADSFEVQIKYVDTEQYNFTDSLFLTKKSPISKNI